MRIYLSTEGTYPFVLGGVSTWVDMLVHGLPHHDFEIGALVDNPHHRIQYRPPPNVTLQPIPLWGLELAEEYLPRRDGWRRAWRTTSPVVRDRFLPSWEHLVDCLAAPEADSRALGDSLSAVAHFAERYDLRRALGDAAAWALLLDRLQTNPIHARTGLAPAMDFARTMYRYLLPLTAPTPVCDVAHSTAAALCVLPAIVAKYRYGTPLVLTEHGIYLRERLLAMSTEPFGTKVLFANFYRAVVELAYREADVLTPVCAYNAGWEEALGVEPDRIRVIHNGVDPARIDVWPDPDGPPTVGFVGRIDPLKDVLTLIQAFARVRARHRGCPPPTVGTGDLPELPGAVPDCGPRPGAQPCRHVRRLHQRRGGRLRGLARHRAVLDLRSLPVHRRRGDAGGAPHRGHGRGGRRRGHRPGAVQGDRHGGRARGSRGHGRSLDRRARRIGGGTWPSGRVAPQPRPHVVHGPTHVRRLRRCVHRALRPDPLGHAPTPGRR